MRGSVVSLSVSLVLLCMTFIREKTLTLALSLSAVARTTTVAQEDMLSEAVAGFPPRPLHCYRCVSFTLIRKSVTQPANTSPDRRPRLCLRSTHDVAYVVRVSIVVDPRKPTAQCRVHLR